jgi:hypothetical protein
MRVASGSAAPTRESRRTRRGPVLLAAGLLSALVACFSTKPATKTPSGQPDSSGSFTVSAKALGRVTIAPSSCVAGDRQLFLGADFPDETAGAVVRLVVDPLDGPAVRVFSSSAPFDKSVVFRRSDCPVFHFSLDPTDWRINHVQDYQVSLELRCATAEGDTIEGRVAVEHCH